MNERSPRAARALTFTSALGFAATIAIGESAHAQLAFSIDYKGPTKSLLDSAQGVPITEGDVLFPGPGAPGIGNLPVPQIRVTGGQLSFPFYTTCGTTNPGDGCQVELDCLSGGIDRPFVPSFFAVVEVGKLWFSTDEWAVGKSGVPSRPNVFSEAAPGVDEVSADIWADLGLSTGPLGPTAQASGHSGVFDGNGLRSGSGSVYFGLGLAETNPPAIGVPNLGDNIDALDIGTLLGGMFPPGGLYVSLDSAFLDPLELVPNTGSAAASGFVGGDVLLIPIAGAPPILYAPAAMLGLDSAGIPDVDDLDALILHENGVTGFQPSVIAYDWLAGTSDMLLFSVRRGSAVVGMPDSLFGAAIEPGDILSTPRSVASGGNGNGNPSIFISAEVLGLATSRTDGVLHGDDLNAMDKTGPGETCYDCNNNGVEDSVDIATGASNDKNYDGIPDECQDIFAFCVGDGTAGPCPCGNESALNAGEGCENSTGGGATLGWSGTSSVAADDLVLGAVGGRPNQPGLFVQGASTVGFPFKDGFFCMGNRTERIEVVFLDGSGAASSTLSIVTEGNVSVGDERFYQLWYRDPAVSPCGTGSNFSSAIRVPWN
ncbi:MAG: hypothetical protein KDC14_07550 [Planctomycetes bacterium]|nr:hypothetical protein [Planctomycetota bacterium]